MVAVFGADVRWFCCNCITCSNIKSVKSIISGEFTLLQESLKVENAITT